MLLPCRALQFHEFVVSLCCPVACRSGFSLVPFLFTAACPGRSVPKNVLSKCLHKYSAALGSKRNDLAFKYLICVSQLKFYRLIMLLLKFQLFAFFTKKQVTLLSKPSKKLVYPGSNHAVIPLCTVQSCWGRTGRG